MEQFASLRLRVRCEVSHYYGDHGTDLITAIFQKAFILSVHRFPSNRISNQIGPPTHPIALESHFHFHFHQAHQATKKIILPNETMRPHITLLWLTNSFFVVSSFHTYAFRRNNYCGRALSDNFCRSYCANKATILSEKSSTATQTKNISSSSRSTAIFALMNSLNKKNPTFAIRQLENDPNFLSLESRDRAFARLLLSTAERRQGQIDKVIAAFMRSSKGQKQKAVDRLCQAALRIGTVQLLFLDVAKHAALQETVEVLRMHPKIKVS
jgi:transcription termination factor NusB